MALSRHWGTNDQTWNAGEICGYGNGGYSGQNQSSLGAGLCSSCCLGRDPSSVGLGQERRAEREGALVLHTSGLCERAVAGGAVPVQQPLLVLMENTDLGSLVLEPQRQEQGSSRHIPHLSSVCGLVGVGFGWVQSCRLVSVSSCLPGTNSSSRGLPGLGGLVT